MNINISEIKYEETFVGIYGDFTHFFTAPKELVKDEHPDCEHATISVERYGCGEYICMISPTAEGIDYDWKDFDLSNECVDALIKLIPEDEVKSKYNPVAIAYNLLLGLLTDTDTKNTDEIEIDVGAVIESAVGYLGEALE